MDTYKIYGEDYPIKPTTKHPVDCYAVKGELVDDPPKGKVLGYVEMDDGSIVECYKKRSLLPFIIILIVAALLLIVAGVYIFFFQPKDFAISGTLIKIGDDNNVVTYDGFMTVVDDNLRVAFTNGDYPAQIVVQGEGIETQKVSVEPGEFVEYIPCTFTTTDGVVEGTITVLTETSTQSFPIVIEVPANNNGFDTEEGLTGLFEGEAVYGVQTTE